MALPRASCDDRSMTRPEPAPEASVLLSFRAENVRSFRSEVEFSLLATGMAESNVVRYVKWRQGGNPIGVLPVGGIFGANASGKTNLLKAMDDMRFQVLHSFRTGSPTGGIWRRPFLLDPACQGTPSRFEVDLVLHGVRHEYGFAVDDERVLEEWAFHYPRGRAALLFQRRGSDVELGPAARAKGRAAMALLRQNALFLSTAASANHSVLLPLYGWFERNLVLAEADSRAFRQAFTAQMLDNSTRREQVLAMLHSADLGISGATKHEYDAKTKERVQRAIRILTGKEGEPEGGEDGPDFEQLLVQLTHQGVDSNIELRASDESLGTLVWFGLVGPIIHALAEGSVFLVDELDASLHPALVAQLVQLFQSPDTNPRRAQLIFNSHDATLLGDTVSDRGIGRDQIWFTEKRPDGSTHLYPLSDLDPRKEEAIGRRYLAGCYGATPILSREQFAAIAELITASGNR